MEAAIPRERVHEFDLVLTDVAELTTDVENALYEAGCDDATINVRAGRIFLLFSRTAASRADAISSAIRDVTKAGISAGVAGIE